MENKRRHFLNAKIVIGIVIIIFGVLVLIDNLGYDLKINLVNYWPLILIIIGLTQLIQPKEYRQYFSGVVLLVLGGIFLAHNFIEDFDFDIGDLWPLIIVLIGVKVLTHGMWGSKKDAISQDHINLSAILGGGEFNFTSKELKGGKITAIMGGCNLNLRDADIAGDTIIIDTFAMMGGIEIRVPKTWDVVMQGTPLLGGMENKTHKVPDEKGGEAVPERQKCLIIKGLAIMGGVEIKN